MADTQSILISVFIFTVIASLLRVNSILLVYQQRREPPEHRQSEPLMIGHKYYFLPLVSLQVIASVSVASTLFPLALRGIDHFLTPFFASTVAISMVGQVDRQLRDKESADIGSVLGGLVSGTRTTIFGNFSPCSLAWWLLLRCFSLVHWFMRKIK
jgi:hypothetical protein